MDMSLLAATIGLLAALVCACVLPVYADSADDLGDGMAEVVIPKHVPTPRFRPRTWAFLGTAALLGLLFVGWQHPSIPVLYIGAVRDVAVAITRNPAAVNGYVARLHPAFLYLTVSYMVGIAVVVRASAARRLVMLASVPLYVAMTLLAQVLMVTVGVTTRLLVGPFGIEATLANLAVGGLVVLRLTFTSFALPRATVLPITRRGWMWDNVATWCALLSAVAMIVVMYALLSVPSNLTTAWEVFLPRYAVCLFFAIMLAPMWLLWWASRRLPEPGGDRPASTSSFPPTTKRRTSRGCSARSTSPRSVTGDRCGSWCRTTARSTAPSRSQAAEIAAFAWPRAGPDRAERWPVRRAQPGAVDHRRGDLHPHRRGLRSWARTRWSTRSRGSGIRTSASSAPWRSPGRDTVTWFHRLRTLETLYQFRFARLAQSVVDGLVCIPGTFMVFRRGPAVGCGGFPVRMNGEDADLTMQIGRQGYRAVIDPRIRCYEDVPRNAAEFVEQRTRWARARFHIVARHVPLRCGSAGPRVWFWLMQRAFSWFSLQTCLVAPIFMLELALTHPTYRQNLATFAGVYIAMDAVPALISVPFAVQHRQWRSLCWLPTHFAYAYLRRLATLEAAITLPVRPFPAPAVPGLAAVPCRAWRPRPPGGEALASPGAIEPASGRNGCSWARFD